MMDIWLHIGFDGQDGSVSFSCGLPGKFSRRQLIVLGKEEFCMHDLGSIFFCWAEEGMSDIGTVS